MGISSLKLEKKYISQDGRRYKLHSGICQSTQNFGFCYMFVINMLFFRKLNFIGDICCKVASCSYQVGQTEC